MDKNSSSKGHGMKIIVAQRHQQNLEGIKAEVARINPARAEEIIYTSNPHAVLDEIVDGQPALVVSGVVFDSSTDGAMLARFAKRLNPRIQFYIYSVCPERNEAVDGIFRKRHGTAASRQHPELAQMLADENLHGMSLEDLKRTYGIS
jgi:DNA-binding NarL/FixJ family response regulator